jgi:hypothetical protein
MDTVMDVLRNTKAKGLKANTIARHTGLKVREVNRICHKSKEIHRGDPAACGSGSLPERSKTWTLE